MTNIPISQLTEENFQPLTTEEKKKFIFAPFECINYSKFDEMKRKLDNYYCEVHKSVTENVKLENENFKKNYFNSLENLLIEISLIKEEKLKISKIDHVFKWFKTKLQMFQNVNKIETKTIKAHFEKYPVLDSYRKPETYEAGNYPTKFEKENRTFIEGDENPKEKLKQYKTKKIVPIKIKILEEKEQNDLKLNNQIESYYANNSKTKEISFQLNSIKKENYTNTSDIDNRLSSANSSNYFRSTNYSSHFLNSNNSNSNNISNINNISGINVKISNINKNLNFPYSSHDLIHKSTEKKINNERILNEIPCENKRDLTSSSSCFRPKYDYSNIVTDKMILKYKTNEINEKRNYEEMKEYLNEWGINKARFREEIEKKYELKNLLNFYEKNFKEKKDTENQKKSTISTLDNLKNYKKNSPSPIKLNGKKPEILLLKGKFLMVNTTETFSIYPMTKKQIKSYASEKLEKEIRKEEFSLKEKIRKGNKIFENFQRLRINKIKNLKNEEDDNDKAKTYSYINLKPTLIKINIKFNENDNFDKNVKLISNFKNTLEKIPPDSTTLFKTHDKIYENRHNFSKLLQVNEIDNKKEGYKFHGNPLSLYDDLNINAISISPVGFNTFMPTTGFDFMHQNHETENENFNFNSFANSKNNFLNQRKTVSFNNKGIFNTNINNILTQKQKNRKSNFNFSQEAIKKAFMPPSDDKKYPKYFLPEAGFGILKNPFEIIKDKKKKIKIVKNK